MKKFLGVILIFVVTAKFASAADQPAKATSSTPEASAQPEIIHTAIGAEIPEEPALEPSWGPFIKRVYPHWREHYWVDRGPWPGANRGIIYSKESPKSADVDVAPAPPEGLTPVSPTGQVEPKIIEQPAPVVTKSTPTSYTVRKGDCLWFVAGKVYGDPMKWTKIYRANKKKVKNPDRIYPGQVLEIPPLN